MEVDRLSNEATSGQNDKFRNPLEVRTGDTTPGENEDGFGEGKSLTCLQGFPYPIKLHNEAFRVELFVKQPVKKSPSCRFRLETYLSLDPAGGFLC
jgi:hypothetical protein